jgi:hypothetical protein
MIDAPLLDWNEPPVVNLSVVRDAFQNEVLPALEAATMAVWKEEVPVSHHRQITRQLRAGLRQGLTEIRRAPRNDLECFYLLHCVPKYWEPAESDTCVAHLPPHQVRAYRWTAALLALNVRNALEELHAKFTSDTRMPALNRGIRNTLYDCLLRNPPVFWRLSEIPRTLVAMAAGGAELSVPVAAG